jgi:hypothetical protein
MKKNSHLLSYAINLSFLTFDEFFSARKTLRNFFKRNLTKQECSEVKDILNIIYLNTGFSRTIISEYAKLQKQNHKEAKRISVFATSLMLLDDFVLDEELPHNKIDIIEKLIIKIEILLENEISFIPLENQSTQRELWGKLRLGQQEDDFELKGHWLSALSFPHKPTMDNAEIEALRQLGIWIKSFDDWADREKDKLSGKRTLFTNASELESLEISEKLRKEAFESFRKTSYGENIKDEFLYKLHVQSIFFYGFCKDLDGRFSKLKKLSEQSFLVSILIMIISTRLVYKDLINIK